MSERCVDLNAIYEEAKTAVRFGEPYIEFSSDQIRTTADHRFFIAVSDIVDALSAARSSAASTRSVGSALDSELPSTQKSKAARHPTGEE